ncbi:dihydrofolate reductase family protein [Paenibacillus sp. CC-CFT747]|nr:dihydrofolate reductase family protein [Paenibacillus sp. CC-CFT747]
MRKVNLYLHMSLDGVVTDLDRWMDYSEEMLLDAYDYYKTVDTIIMGGQTYASMAGYWQAAERTSESALERDVARRINAMEKLVLTRSDPDLVWANSQRLIVKEREAFVQEITALQQKTACPSPWRVASVRGSLSFSMICTMSCG